MVKLKCLMCGDIYEADLLNIKWQFSCGICSSTFLSEVIEISESEIDTLKNHIHTELQRVKLPENSIVFSIHDPLYKTKQLENVLPLMCLISDYIVLDNAHALIGCSEEFIKMVYNLVDENLIKLCDFQPLPRSIYSDDIFEGRIDDIWLPFEIPSLKDVLTLRDSEISEYTKYIRKQIPKSAMNCYYALENLATYITTMDLHRFYNVNSNVSIRKIYKQMEKLGFPYPGYDTLNLNFTSINYATLVASELNANVIFNETRMGLMHIKYAELDSSQKKLRALNHLMKERVLTLPPLNAEEMLELRDSEQIEELKYILNKIFRKSERKPTTELDLILKNYDKAVDGYNKHLESKFNKGSIILGCLLGIIGGSIGGPLGAILGGFGPSISTMGFEYFVKKYFSKKKTKWPLLFLKEH